MNPSSLGALPTPPARVFPPPPRGARWREIPSSGLPRGLALGVPMYVWSDGSFVYSRAVAVLPNGTAFLILRIFPRGGQLQTRFDRFYTSGPAGAAATLGSAPATVAPGQWERWSGELPAPVGVAFEGGRRPGQDWRATLGSHAWLVRADAHGGASYTLGSPPFTRRIAVSAWRMTPAATPARAPLRAVAFLGDPSNPWPPAPDGWAETVPDDETRAELAPGLLGELPIAHYVDAWTRTGLYRFFAYETGAGQKAIGSLRYWGVGSLGAPGTLGDVAGDFAAFDAQTAAGDSAMANGDFSGAVTDYQAAGSVGASALGPDLDAQTNGASQPLTQQAWGLNTTLASIGAQNADQPSAQAAQGLAQQMRALYAQAQALAPAPSGGAAASTPLQQAAVAMNAALTAHGYKRADQPLYRAFQSAAGLAADGFPGARTMGQLQTVLSGLGITLAPVKIYPWSASGGFDGVNAPTLAEWTGAAGGGAAPAGPPAAPSKPAVVQAGMSAGGVAATVLAVAALVGGIGWAAYTGNLPSLPGSTT
jgi:hypothetical protein